MSLSLDNLLAEVEGGVLYRCDKYPRHRRYSVPSIGENQTLGDMTSAMQYQCSTRIGVRMAGSSGMDDRDKRIYNSLGDTSGAKGKVQCCACKSASLLLLEQLAKC